MATMNQSNEDLLLHHAGLLAKGRTDSAAALTRGASVNKDTVALMNVAANVHAALPSVTPEPGFRSRLESQITAQARSAQRTPGRLDWRRFKGRNVVPRRPTFTRLRSWSLPRRLPRNRARRLFGQGAAVALIGVVTLWCSSRGLRRLMALVRDEPAVTSPTGDPQVL